MNAPAAIVCAALLVASFVQAPQTQRAASPPPPRPDDPALLRIELLRRLDARIDEAATKAKLDARLALDEVFPLPYLGVDASSADGRLVLTAVYADTGAERGGLKKGDALLTFDGDALDSKTALARHVRAHRPGDGVQLEIERDGRASSVRATLGVRPEEDEDEDEQFPDLVVPKPVPPARTLSFDDAPSGQLPPAFESLLGGHGHVGAWSTVASERGLALRQQDADPTGIRFPMAMVRDWEASDASAKVRFRYAGGRVDRAAGVILRWRDPGNYYVARANALEGDLRIFRVVNGERRTLLGAIAQGATDDDRWHTLEFSANGAHLVAMLDGRAKAEAFDSFFLRGRSGLWTKSDSQTEFDDFELEASK